MSVFSKLVEMRKIAADPSQFNEVAPKAPADPSKPPVAQDQTAQPPVAPVAAAPVAEPAEGEGVAAEPMGGQMSMMREVLGDEIFSAAMAGDPNAQNIIAATAAKVLSGQ